MLLIRQRLTCSKIYLKYPLSIRALMCDHVHLTSSRATSESSSSAVSSCALAKLSTAIARNTFSRVSGYRLRMFFNVVTYKVNFHFGFTILMLYAVWQLTCNIPQCNRKSCVAIDGHRFNRRSDSKRKL